MTTSPVTGTNQTYTTANTSARQNAATGAMQELGKDAFLELLVTQLRYQDPLNPQDNSQFIAQMAQFSALEQMQNLNDTMNQLLQLQAGAKNIAPAYLGLQVAIMDSNGGVVEGTVSAVEFVGKEPWLIIEENAYPLSS